ncbi:energy transducer TonB [Pusillimonas sp. ANT_WB101]|uniref:energy transducer TonB n=1 Tax=Pusillimonas sp. ANT_WB101 TaxID=2597356 RepID=UPI0011EFE17A|nr:energy transducer TonB [Pusillimonas sp. ANT_WB101]KAA0911570.1 energy transducer TonB [Pusillimonas sp. ANT_WB101]
MSFPRVQANSRHTLTKIVGASAAIGLHLAVLAAIIASPPKSQIELPESVEIRFVEISDDIVDAAPSEEEAEADIPAPEQWEEVMPEPIIEPEPVIEPQPEPEPEPIIEPEPTPEPVIEPEPEPEPVVEKPEPEAITPPPPPKPKPEPKPKPKPKPQPKPKPVEKPVFKEAPAAAPSGNAATPAVPKAPSRPVDPNRPRVIGRVDYMGKRPMPEYPRMSQRRGEQGRVLIRVLIAADGSVLKASVQRSSGHDRLDQSALKAARSARFKPYTENGIAYQALADIPFDFVL